MTELDHIEKMVELARKLATTAVAMRKAVATGDLQSAATKLAGAQEVLEQLRSQAEGWPILSKSWTRTLEERFLELEADFRRDCSDLGWHVDGQWPELYVQRAVAVRFDDKNRSAFVAGRALNLIDSKSLTAALRPIVQDLLPKRFSPSEFIQSLSEAYDEARGSQTQPSILSVYRAYVLRLQRPRFWRDARQDSFIGLTLEQFRARISGSLEAGAIRVRDGRELRLIPPLDAADAIFIYQPAERRFGHIGRIEFFAA